MHRLALRLSIGWILFVPLWTAWQVATYGGWYRWLCERELESSGSYDAMMTAIVPSFLLITPAILVLRHYLPAQPPPRAVPRTQAENERVGLRVLATVGLGSAALCATALIWAATLPGGAGPAVTVDLATLGTAPPPLGRVRLIGTVDAAHVTIKNYGGKVALHGERNLYAPMIVPGDAAGPRRIFVKEFVTGDIAVPLPSAAGNVFRGVLVTGGLPGDMKRQFERLGVHVAQPYYLLMTGPDGARGNAYVVAGLLGLLALSCLLPITYFLVTKRMRRTR
jgi:hypothetical protein